MPAVLNALVVALCPHGGKVQVVPSQPVIAVGAPLIVMSDVTTVVGCSNPPQTGGPCVLVQWTMPAARVKADGQPVLTQSSIGLCISALGAAQGKAQITPGQQQVSAQ